jgi:hypothetical protein
MLLGGNFGMAQGRNEPRGLSIDAAVRARLGAIPSGVLLAIVFVACLAGALALVVGLRSSAAKVPEVAVDVPTQRASEPSAPESDATRRAVDASAAESSRASVAAIDDASRFDGRGVIRGRVRTDAGIAFPSQWKLSVFPSPTMHGEERAESRTIEFTGGEDTFRVDDLPLGAYGVRADAVGLNCLAVTVILVRGAENQFVSLLLTPAGYVRGSVIDAEGRPAEGVPVTLESTATRARRTQESDAAGGYHFDDVLDGEYALYFGRPEAPLIAPDSLAFRAPAMTVPERKLPPTATATVWTRDDKGAPIADVLVSGFSSHAGVIDVRTGRDGSALVRYLPAGRYRLHARLEDGRSGTATVELTAGESAMVEIKVEP